MRNPCKECDYYHEENNTCQSKKCCTGGDGYITWIDRLFCKPYKYTADRKTESNSEIPNNFDKDTNVRSKDEPQTEMTTEQIVNELLSIKQILDDGKMPKQRCGNCKHLTYRFNKTWCDIKCDNPHDVVCDKWERSE